MTDSIDLLYIAEGLRNLAVPIDSLHEDGANARVGHDVERIAASLAQFGQRKPLIVNRVHRASMADVTRTMFGSTRGRRNHRNTRR